jgi:hypothetical protein
MEVTEDTTAMKNQPSKPAIPCLGIPECIWWKEALHGVAGIAAQLQSDAWCGFAPQGVAR